MGKVAYLPQRHPSREIAAGPLFEAAWHAFPESGKRRSSRRLSVVAWASAACECGERELLQAVLRYVREDPDIDGNVGAPGFHRWLSDARWEYWL